MVSIDNVYRTVLNILNKENRGYVTPAEFNTLAKQAQTEIFEMYFTTQYRIQQGPMSDGDYSDIMRNIEEKITLFDNTTRTIDRTLASIAVGGIAASSSGISTTLALNAAIDSSIILRQIDTIVTLDGVDYNFNSQASPTSISVFGDVPGFTDNTATISTGNLSRYPTNLYRLGVVFTATGNIHVDEVSDKDALYINLSPLTAPTATQPIYTRSEGGVRVYPDNTDVRMVYLREPAIPLWVGATTGGQLVVNTTDTVDFELHASEEPELVAKILSYSGVIIRSQEVVQAAAAKEQQIGQDNG